MTKLEEMLGIDKASIEANALAVLQKLKELKEQNKTYIRRRRRASLRRRRALSTKR